ncbi:MAG: 3-5 exonuclease [Bacteroidota bacterium]|nr:3-5 exonuclease [Bacteroidota bacterium]
MNQEQYLAFDIETSPLAWDSFSESQQEFITRYAKSEEEVDRKKNEMGLSPFTAQVVCIGLQLMEKTPNGWETANRAAFAVDSSTGETGYRTEKLASGDNCYLSNEKKLLEDFWKIIVKYSNAHLVSFNGRGFDAPFLMLRSALLNVRPSRNIMDGTKFNYRQHTDLIDELCFYMPTQSGATKRFNLDFYTQAFGIKSPKSEGLDGSKVSEYFSSGRILEIAEYCLRDVSATWDLFLIWREYLRF